MKNIIQKSILLLAIIGLWSCSDFLEESSQDEVIPSTIEDLDQLLAYEGYPRRDFTLMPYLNLLDDDVTQYITSNNAKPVVTKYSPLYLWGGRSVENNENMFDDFNNLPNPTTDITSIEVDSYATLYKMIAGCNVVLDMINEVSGESETKKKSRGRSSHITFVPLFQPYQPLCLSLQRTQCPTRKSSGNPIEIK